MDAMHIHHAMHTVPVIDAVLLAAGNSARFGENKLLYPVDHKPMYRYMLELLDKKQQERKLNRLVVVSQYEEILSDIREHFPHVQAVKNTKPENGISGSVRLGLACLLQRTPTDDSRLWSASAACLFAVADQPGFSADSFEKLLNFWRTHDYGIAASAVFDRSDGAPDIRNPVIFSNAYYQELLQLTGDAGGRQVIRKHIKNTGLCELPAAELKDLDTKDALRQFESRLLLVREFPFLNETGHVISIVGAGGKTTLMELLASYYADMGKRVIVTTTTHILCPQRYPTAKNHTQLIHLLINNQIVAAGKDALHGKLQMSDCMSVADYREAADVVLIEADGAKHYPCKAPSETEPVIPDESDLVIGVVGMDALGLPLSKACFRIEQVKALLGKSQEHLLTEADMAKILLSDRGTRKNVGKRTYYIVLNKCLNAALWERAGRVGQMLVRAGERHVVCMGEL